MALEICGGGDFKVAGAGTVEKHAIEDHDQVCSRLRASGKAVGEIPGWIQQVVKEAKRRGPAEAFRREGFDANLKSHQLEAIQFAIGS